MIECSIKSLMFLLHVSDVIAEEERVRSGAADESSLILVKDIKKMYAGGKYAVRGLSIGIPNGECFGLLGESMPYYTH